MVQVRQIPLGPLQTNCYLLGCEATNLAAVIDPAFDGKSISAIADQDGWQVSHILITHTHFDHIGGLNDVRDATGAPVFAHREAFEFLAKPTMPASFFGIDLSQQVSGEYVSNKQLIDVGKIRLKVLYTPGHAPGHVSFHAEDYGLLFCGDVLFHLNIGRTDMEGGDYELLMTSIKDHVLTLPDETLLFPGHGPNTTIGVERKHNPFLRELHQP